MKIKNKKLNILIFAALGLLTLTYLYPLVYMGVFYHSGMSGIVSPDSPHVCHVFEAEHHLPG